MNEKRSNLEEGLILALRAIDNQIAREMQRTPAEREELGTRKWQPYQTRVESITSLILNSLGENEVGLDSLIVMAQALAKALRLVVDDLGPKGLGKTRSEYCLHASEQIARDAKLATIGLNSVGSEVN